MSAIVTLWITVRHDARAETGVQKIQHGISSAWRGTVLHKPLSADRQLSCHKLGYKVILEHMQISLRI
jgi:hypothetical protein